MGSFSAEHSVLFTPVYSIYNGTHKVYFIEVGADKF